MAKLLAIDLDGTLFYPKNIKRCIPRKNVKFLRRWIDVGNKLVLVTSRSTQFIEKLKDEIKRPVDFITCCSSQIIADNKLIYDKAMPNREIKEIVETIEKAYEPIALLMTTDNHPCIIKTSRKVSFIFRWFYKIWWWFQFAYREPFVADDELFVKELETARIFKIMIFIGLKKKKAQIAKELNKEFRQKFPEIESSWTVQVNELTPEGCNKGNGVKRYCQLTGIKPEDVYVVGDSGNDITMFSKYHEHSYCMKRGHPSARKYAKYIISRVYKLENLILEGENHE